MRYLKAEGLNFVRHGPGVSVTIPGEGSFDDVDLVKAFPHSHPDEYICVMVGEKQIGIVRSISELDADSRNVIEEELRRRYFMPTIKRVSQLKKRLRGMRWEVVTDRGKAGFETKGLQDCFTEIGGKTIVTDVEGNRYYLDPGAMQI